MILPADVKARLLSDLGTDDDALVLLAAMQSDLDRLKELEDDLPPAPDLLVRIDGGTVVKFDNERMLADWIVGMWEQEGAYEVGKSL